MDETSGDGKDGANVPLLQERQENQENAGNGRNEIGNDEQGKQSENLSNKWQSIWNITNGQQGASLLGAPYAVSVGGFWSLIPLAAITIISNYTSKILIQCLIKDDRGDDVAIEEIKEEKDAEELKHRDKKIQNGHRRIRYTYMEVASDCFPGCGVIVRVAILISAFSISVLHLQTMAAILLDISQNYVEIERDAILAICVGASVGFAFASNLTQLSFLSFLALICLVMLTLGVDTFTMKHLDALYVDYLTPFGPYNLLYATSIIVFNFSSQFFIIDIHNSLDDKSNFNFVVNVSSLVSVILIFAVSLPACLSFGPTIDEFVIFSMPNGIYRTLTCLAFLLKSFLTFPLTIFICEIYSPRWFYPDSNEGPKLCFGKCDLDYLLKFWRRVLLMSFACVVSICIESYASVLYFIGGTVMVFTEIMFPPLFHMILRKQLTVVQKLADVLMILYGLVIGLSTVTISIQNIISGGK